MDKLEKQFFNTKAFHIIANDLWKRYYNNENFGVSLSKSKIKQLNTDNVRGLLGIGDVDWQKKSSIKVSDLEASLQQSVFEWTLKDFVENITEKKLEIKQNVLRRERDHFNQCLELINKINPIFSDHLNDKQLTRWFRLSDFIHHFEQVDLALRNKPNEYQRIPVFAYNLTGDPHAFDESRPSGQLLDQMLMAMIPETSVNIDYVEAKRQRLVEFNLLKDDIKNNVAIRGITAEKNGVLSEMWDGACKENSPWVVPLKEIFNMDTIYPYNHTKVLVVENAIVYSILLELLPNTPIICSSGQFTFAVWKILEKISEAGNQIYYAGDLDPEGLLMAERLMKRFPENAQTISLTLDSYHSSINKEKINPNRLIQLRHIEDEDLILIANEITNTGLVGYQEGFIEQLIEEVKMIF